MKAVGPDLVETVLWGGDQRGAIELDQVVTCFEFAGYVQIEMSDSEVIEATGTLDEWIAARNAAFMWPETIYHRPDEVLK